MKAVVQKASISKGRDPKTSHARTMSELMSLFSSKIKPVKKGDIVEGTVKKLTPKEITLDIGAKSDALVLEFDRKNVENLLKILKVGDKVKASVLSAESEEGFPVVSLRRTLDDLIFLELEDQMKNGKNLEVYILEATRGGFFAETGEGIRGFLPNSQVLDSLDLVGRTIPVKIIEFDRENKRVIFSQKALVYLMNPSEIEKQVKKDEILQATVTGIANHGLYVSIEKTEAKIEGFVHISEISYQRIEDIASLYKRGETIKVQVIDVDYENRRINASIKRLEKDTFAELKNQYKKDQTVKAIITKVGRKGVTLELAPNILGFIPEWKIASNAAYEPGTTIDALVEEFDDRHRLIILSPILKAAPIGYR